MYTGDVQTQTIELLRKRYITTSRDLKGLFFQVVFPAIQILLILAILTININPAGKTVKMNVSIFGFKPYTLVGGTMNRGGFAKNLSSDRLILRKYNANTSLAMSVDLLQSGNTLFSGAAKLRKAFPPTDHRLGGIIVNDRLPVSVNVDWVWVKGHINAILENVYLFELLLTFAGIDTSNVQTTQSFAVPTSTVLSILGSPQDNPKQTSQKQLRKDIIDFTQTVNFNQTIVNRFLNSTVFTGFNLTQYRQGTNVKENVTVGFTGVTAGSKGITFGNVIVTRGGSTVRLDKVTLTPRQIRTFLPDHTIGKLDAVIT